jgi:hypothetical protein
MSFAGDVKTELCRIGMNRKCCVQAECYGILLYCNTFSANEIRIITENENLAQRLPVLFKKAFKITFDRLPEGEGKYIFAITDREKLEIIQQTFGGGPGALALHINFGVLEERCCRVSFLRGAFLAGGSVTDPLKGYHLELVTSHHSVSREMLALMREMDLEPKAAPRKGNAVVYFKQSDRIEDFLTTIGAPLSAMEAVGAVTGIPSFRDSEQKGILQTLDQLAFGIRDVNGEEKNYAMLVIADPISDEEISDIISRHRRLSSQIHTAVKMTGGQSLNRGESKDANAGVTRVTNYSYTPIYTVREGEAVGNKDRRVVRIEKALEAYEENFLDKVTDATAQGMQKALTRIGERIVMPEDEK